MEQDNETFDFESAMREATRRAVEAPHDIEQRVFLEDDPDSFFRVQKRNGRLITERVIYSVDLGDVAELIRDEEDKILAATVSSHG